ncbi:MAG: hypothetical protein HRT47_11915, partial [Candidatus Caenarcaniphilales bacterium]|nr:hypothetical protein [Candidatus Caenarcaniphilales bacterium]
TTLLSHEYSLLARLTHVLAHFAVALPIRFGPKDSSISARSSNNSKASRELEDKLIDLNRNGLTKYSKLSLGIKKKAIEVLQDLMASDSDYEFISKSNERSIKRAFNFINQENTNWAYSNRQDLKKELIALKKDVNIDSKWIDEIFENLSEYLNLLVSKETESKKPEKAIKETADKELMDKLHSRASRKYPHLFSLIAAGLITANWGDLPKEEMQECFQERKNCIELVKDNINWTTGVTAFSLSAYLSMLSDDKLLASKRKKLEQEIETLAISHVMKGNEVIIPDNENLKTGFQLSGANPEQKNEYELKLDKLEEVTTTSTLANNDSMKKIINLLKLKAIVNRLIESNPINSEDPTRTTYADSNASMKRLSKSFSYEAQKLIANNLNGVIDKRKNNEINELMVQLIEYTPRTMMTSYSPRLKDTLSTDHT